MRETVKTDGTVTSVLDFIYDESGKPFAMIDQLSAQPKTYYYVLNLQGDVVKLIDQDGAETAAYTYDAWGNILSSSGSMAETNPLRYRGYYYDSDTSNAVRSTIKEMTRSDIASAIYSTIKDFALAIIK
jgi:YD repeat-containing protein